MCNVILTTLGTIAVSTCNRAALLTSCSFSEALSQALPEPPAPLPRQKYFHGSISRIEAEALLEKDGQFLIRESSKRPGQYVLTGMANGKPQHLLLMDKEGKVRSHD